MRKYFNINAVERWVTCVDLDLKRWRWQPEMMKLLGNGEELGAVEGLVAESQRMWLDIMKLVPKWEITKMLGDLGVEDGGWVLRVGERWCY